MRNFIIGIIFIIAVILSSWITKISITDTGIARIDTVTISDTAYIRDTIRITKYTPKYIEVIDTAWMTDLVDTMAILRKYHNKVVILDTIIDDSALFVSIQDTLQFNEIQSRSPVIIRNYPVITTNTIKTVYKNDNGIYVGGYVGQDIGAQVVYKRNNYMFGANVGKNGVFGSVSIKINSK